MASVLDQQTLTPFKGSEGKITPKGLIMDTTVFYYQTNNEDEAHYLCAFLNSSILNNSVKAFQPKGAYGYRDIGRRPLMMPIPQFDNSNPKHSELSERSKRCHQIISSKTFSKTSWKSMRNEAIKELKDGIEEIDGIIDSLGYLCADSTHQTALFA